MDPDGSNQVLLTGDNYAIGAAWSPDGSRISFLSVDRSDFLKSYIWTMNADGSNPVQLTDEPRNSYPTWSPDGTKIVFTRVANGFKAIWIMDADGGNEVKLMNNRDVGGRLSWVSSEQRTTLIEALSWGRLKANFR
jgi:Tol biopolymer transport system component